MLLLFLFSIQQVLSLISEISYVWCSMVLCFLQPFLWRRVDSISSGPGALLIFNYSKTILTTSTVKAISFIASAGILQSRSAGMRFQKSLVNTLEKYSASTSAFSLSVSTTTKFFSHGSFRFPIPFFLLVFELMYFLIVFGFSFAFLVSPLSYSLVMFLFNLLTWFLTLLYSVLTDGSLFPIAFLLWQCFSHYFSSVFLSHGVPLCFLCFKVILLLGTYSVCFLVGSLRYTHLLSTVSSYICISQSTLCSAVLITL